LQGLVSSWKSVGAGRSSGCALWRADRQGRSILLAEPHSYMNESGVPLTDLIRSLGLGLDRFLILHDEIDLPLGRAQFKRGGSSAGHRGVDSLYQQLGETDFYRLRIGIGRHATARVKDYVLSDFSREEMGILQSEIPIWSGGLEEWIKGSPGKAAQIINTPPTSDPIDIPPAA